MPYARGSFCAVAVNGKGALFIFVMCITAPVVEKAIWVIAVVVMLMLITAFIRIACPLGVVAPAPPALRAAGQRCAGQ